MCGIHLGWRRKEWDGDWIDVGGSKKVEGEEGKEAERGEEEGKEASARASPASP